MTDYRLCYGVGSGPGGLEVEASRDAVDVEHFASEVEVGHVTTLKGRWIDS